MKRGERVNVIIRGKLVPAEYIESYEFKQMIAVRLEDGTEWKVLPEEVMTETQTEQYHRNQFETENQSVLRAIRQSNCSLAKIARDHDIEPRQIYYLIGKGKKLGVTFERLAK